jgi:hypothetical protein
MGCAGYTQISCGIVGLEPTKYDYCTEGKGEWETCYRKAKGSTPVPDNNKKKKKKQDPQPQPQTGCKDEFGNVVDNSRFPEDFKTTSGLTNFKDYLVKYHSTKVDNLGGTQKLYSEKIDGCMLINLFNSGVPVGWFGILGAQLYPDWQKYVKTINKTITEPSLQEHEDWTKKSPNSTNETNETNETTEEKYQGTWDDLINSNQVPKDGVLITIGDEKAMMFKIENVEGTIKRSAFDSTDKDENGQITSKSLSDNINYTLDEIKEGKDPSKYYVIWRTPTLNTDKFSENFPLKVKIQIVFKNGDSGITVSSDDKATTIGYLPKPTENIKLKESKKQINLTNKISNFILERIKIKNLLLMEGDPCPCPNGSYSEACCLNTTPIDDLFGILSNEQLKDGTAKKNFIESKTPIIQDLINRGARSNYFIKWNDLASNSAATTKLKLPKPDNTGVEITKTNAYQIGEPAATDMGQYKSEPFYMLLKINGDQTKNKATIFTPINVTEEQTYITASSDPVACRVYLIDYLRGAIKKESVGNEFEQWKKRREVCDCNANGGFINFKTRGKDEELGKETWRKDRLKIRPDKSEFKTKTETQRYDQKTGKWVNKVVVNDLGSNSPFLPVFNKNLNWKEIKSLLNGERYKTKDGESRTIDEDWVITGFDSPGSICENDQWRLMYQYPEEGTVQKESLDNRIEKKLSETIKSKNKKETLVENVLKKLLKDKL